MADVLTVHRAGPADEADWRRLWAGWQAHMKSLVPEQATARCWQQMMAGDDLLAFLARLPSGEAVGFANVSRTPFAWTASPSLFLQDLYVVPEARGKGAGQALMQAIYAHADQIGADQVFWMVDETDMPLQRFYGRVGRRSPYLRYMRNGWPW
jgi:GNAT superfamily N-acetyltransferase